MIDRPGTAVLNHLYRTAAGSPLADLSDADLLRRFAARAGPAEAAFAALVRRHGPTVLRVCRANLTDPCDVEDAFQATFLVLANKAPSLIRPASLGPWLYGVARRVADQARRANARRRRHEHRAAGQRLPTVEAVSAVNADLAATVRAAIDRLPERLRASVVLCDLNGLSYQEAADRLGWTHAAVRGRLARARQRLRVALARTGIAATTATLTTETASAVPPALVATTARLAVRVAAGAAGSVPASVQALIQGGMMAMILTKTKAAGLSILTAAVLVAGAIGLSAQDKTSRSAPDNAAGVTISDAERIARLARAAQLQQGAGDTSGAVDTLNKIEAATRTWRERLQKAGGTAERWRVRSADVEQRLAKLQEEATAARREYEAAENRTAELLKQLQARDREIAALRDKFTPQVPVPMPEDFKGTIRKIQGDLATITPGSDAGAAVGAVLQVYRLQPEPEYLGTMMIQAVTPHEAVGRLQGTAKGRVKVDDDVAARLR